MFRLIWLIPLLPLAGAVVNGLLGRGLRFSETLINSVAVGSVVLAFALSLAAVYSYGYGANAQWPRAYVTSEDGGFPHSWTWLRGGATEITQGARERTQAGDDAATRLPVEATRGSVLDVEWSYQLDPLSSVFILIVTGVGLCIFVFATGYMRGDTGGYRFFAYLGLFMFAMLVLVLGSNFLMMFVGWEGVGLCSYLLIGYYFDRKEAGDAARKAFVVNRVGDFGFALAVFGVIATFGSTQYTFVLEQARAYPLELLGTFGIMSWLALGLFVGACGKSAQIPLYVWLPDAMAGPTPVSALIHAATMVTAGLYMLARTNVIFQHSQTMMLIVAIVGALTALLAATIALTQNDIKKVLAYSTVSQLGLMFLACGVGAFATGIFHVMTHAFFKALLFLGAGSVIHGMNHEQDVRRMGGLRRYLPKTHLAFLAGWLAICGVFPFSGFWSKDEILWRAASTKHIPGGWLLWLVGTIVAGCTAFYMTRLVALTFWGQARFMDVPAGGQADEAHAHGYDERLTAHDAPDESAGDRMGHEPGDYVGEPHGAPHEHLMPRGATTVHHDTHGHRTHTPHESPPSMWVPLIVLAVLATFGGLVGISSAFTGGSYAGGRLNIVLWLDPIIWNPVSSDFGNRWSAGDEALREYDQREVEKAIANSPNVSEATRRNGTGVPYAPYDNNTGFNLAHAAESSFGERGAELLFSVISLLAAGLGIVMGLWFYLWRPRLPGVWAARLRPLYRASLNKYWVDELYGLLFTRRTADAARGVYFVDAKAVDGAVNGAAWTTRRLSRFIGNFDLGVVDGAVNFVAGFISRLASPLLRAAQTGLAANYALVMVIGFVVAVAVFFSSDILSALR